MLNLVEKFLVRNHYTHFNKKDISLQLEIHPENSSFKAITDTLDYFGIENLAANVSEEALSLLPNNFLTIVKDKHQRQLVLVRKKNKMLYTTNEKGEHKKLSLNEFKQIWTKNIIAIEETKKSKNRFSLKNSGVFLLVILLLAFLIIKQISFINTITLILFASGLYISYLLVKEKIGFHSKSVLTICSSMPNSNCNDVLNSKGGMPFKNVSLADASFLFFFILLFQGIFFETNGVSSILILLSIPVILFSTYYQAFTLKKWCPLCLAVSTVLILLNTGLFFELNFSFSILSIFQLLTISTVFITIYFFIKTLIKTRKKNEQELITATQFKRSPVIVRNLIKDAKQVQEIQTLNNEIVIGNPKGTYKITTYTNPLCGFCKAAFESYRRLIKMNENIKVLIRFNLDIEEPEASATKIAIRLIEVFEEEDQNAFIDAYQSWFDDRDIETWMKKHKPPKLRSTAMDLLKEHKKWSIDNKIEYAPATILLNKLFPSSYGHKDLVYVINDIIEFQVNEKEPIIS